MKPRAEPNQTSRKDRRTAAFRGLARSLLINALGTYLLYRLLLPHFPSGSVMPLGLSGLLPLFGLSYGIVRQRSIDIIALFAAEDVTVSLLAILLARTPAMVLVGRSMHNDVLGLIFLGSLLLRKPLMLYVARQFVTGNDPAATVRFDQMASQPDAIRVYRTMTLIWALVLFARSAASVTMALMLSADRYLILSPLVGYGSDMLLVWWSISYGYSKLGHYADTSLHDQNAASDVATNVPEKHSSHLESL